MLYCREEEEASAGKTIFPGWRKRNKSATDAQLQSSSTSSLNDLLLSNSSSSDNSRLLCSSNNVGASDTGLGATGAASVARKRSFSEETPAGMKNTGNLDSLFKASLP